PTTTAARRRCAWAGLGHSDNAASANTKHIKEAVFRRTIALLAGRGLGSYPSGATAMPHRHAQFPADFSSLRMRPRTSTCHPSNTDVAARGRRPVQAIASQGPHAEQRRTGGLGAYTPQRSGHQATRQESASSAHVQKEAGMKPAIRSVAVVLG